MMKALLQLDQNFFRLINDTWKNSFFDWLMPLLRIPSFWGPLYLFMACLIIFNVKKKAGWLLLFLLITVTITDQVSSTLIKHNFHRLRPCANAALEAWRHAMVGCPGNSSFTSSHAANHFAIATFFFITLKPYFGKAMYAFFLWAAIICYAQVYVGVHYPLDVAGGAVVGVLLGCLVAFLYNKTVDIFQRQAGSSAGAF